MTPDDPRHGTYAGASQHWKDGDDLCPPCAKVGARVRKRNRYLEVTGQPATVPKVGTVRRVRALQCLGWTLSQIAETAGVDLKTLKNPLYRGSTCYRATAAAVADAYERLAMRFPPEKTTQQKRDASYNRSVARTRGWYPPLCWDDIDNPAARPTGKPRAGTDYDRADLIDEATVLRILSGEVLHANAAERREVMRRWLAAGHSERSLCERMGWKDGRYTPDGEAA